MQTEAPNPAAAQTDDGHTIQPIYIVGVNIDRKSAWWHKQAGNLVRVDESVYLDARLTEEERLNVLRDHALRITQLRRPNSHLCGSSAFHHGQVAGTVSTIGERSIGTAPVGRIGGVDSPSLGGRYGFMLHTFGANWFYQAGPAAFTSIRVQDSLGAFNISALSEEALLLEAFSTRKTRPAQTMLNLQDVDRLADKLLRSHGSVEDTLARIKRIADRTGQVKPYQRASEFLQRKVAYTQEKRYLHDFAVLWAGRHVASLQCDGGDWSMEYERSCAVPLTLAPNHASGHVPSFIASLLPERGLKGHEHFEEGFNEFVIADRYMSNITVRPIKKAMQPVIVDQLEGRLSNFAGQDLSFLGEVSPRLLAAFQQADLSEKLARDPRSARISGIQFKLPCHLDESGVLDLAFDKPFTHILKIASSNPDFASMAANEFFTMSLAGLCGVDCEHFVALDVGAGAPSFLAERFDIRSSSEDKTMILAEDFWSVMSMRRNADKYGADLGIVGDVLRSHSTHSAEDSRRLFRQVVFSWVAANQDMHLKNLLMLKEANAELDGFSEIRLSPAFDLVCTAVYPAAAMTASLHLENSGEYDARKLRNFGKRLRISADDVDQIMVDVIHKVAEFMPPLINNLPDSITAHEQSMEHINRAAVIISERAFELAQQMERPTQEVARRNSFRRSGPGSGGSSFSF